MTYYSLQPVKDHAFRAGEDLIVVNCFPLNVRLIMLRRYRQYDYCGFVEGDGAVVLRESHAKYLRVMSVSEVSGWAKGIEVAETAWPIGG